MINTNNKVIYIKKQVNNHIFVILISNFIMIIIVTLVLV